ncbi:DNA cytosine methyltransferase [Schaalia turicensis]|uniref:DNA cytosine methyltransferase n=1 Tax=Schaalia turicensis TaxID=131111 RepID=UPI003F63647A
MIDHGFEETGKVKTIYANEFDPYAAQTYEQNFDLKVDGRDIHEVAPEDVPDADIFVGGFPPLGFFSGGISSNMGEGGHNVQTGICAQFLSLSQCSAKPEAIVVSNAPAELQPRRKIVGLILETGQET